MDKNLMRDVGDTIEREFEARGWRTGSPIGSIPMEAWRARAAGIPVAPRFPVVLPAPAARVQSPMRFDAETVAAGNSTTRLRAAFWQREWHRAKAKRLREGAAVSVAFVLTVALIAWAIVAR